MSHDSKKRHGHGDSGLDEWQTLMVDWLNNPPEHTRPSVVVPRPAYTDRTVQDIELFLRRIAPRKKSKDIVKQILRGNSDIFRNCLFATGTDLIYVPMDLRLMKQFGFADGEIEIPIGIEEPNWWPGHDHPGGGGGREGGADPADIVYVPITYEEFLELLGMMFNLPWLLDTAHDKMLIKTFSVRGKKKNGPRARWDKIETAKERIKRFKARFNTHPEEFPDFDSDSVPTVEQFPFIKQDLRYKRVEEKWKPHAKAVVSFKLDISGSMAGEPMAVAKFFFFLVLLWLTIRYKDVAVVFIAHNAKAERIPSAAEFFGTLDNGGTMFVPAYDLEYEILTKEFGSDWNKYSLHATDGYNFDGTGPVTDCIERAVRQGQFRLVSMVETDPWGGRFAGRWTTPGWQAYANVAPDVKKHVSQARAITVDDVPAAVEQIVNVDKSNDAAS